MSSVAQLFASATGPENIWSEPQDLAAYTLWPSADSARARCAPPLVVLRPVNLAEVSAIFRICTREGLQVAIRGEGSEFCDAPLPAGRVLLLTGALQRILGINRTNRTIQAQCGVSLGQIRQRLEPLQLFCPPLAGSVPATLGGALAMNMASQRTLRYGPLSAYVQELEVITPEGDRFGCAGQNGGPGSLAPGFPVSQLICGSEGKLALIGSATLRLAPAPQARCDVLACYATLEEAVAAARSLCDARVIPCALTLFHGLALPVAGNLEARTQACLWLGLEGESRLVDDEMEGCLALLAKHSRPALTQLAAGSAAELDRAQANLGAVMSASSACVALRCPPDKMAALLEGAAEILARSRLRWSVCGQLLLCSVRIFLAAGQDAAGALQELFTLERILNDELHDEGEMAQGRAQWKRGQGQLDGLSASLRRVFDPNNLLG